MSFSQKPQTQKPESPDNPVFANNINYIYHQSTILAMVQEVSQASVDDTIYFESI